MALLQPTRSRSTGSNKTAFIPLAGEHAAPVGPSLFIGPPTNPIRPRLRKCWMVWSRAAGLPSVVHRSRKSAVLEAWRLAVKHPGHSFLVMEAVDVRKLSVGA